MTQGVPSFRSRLRRAARVARRELLRPAPVQWKLVEPARDHEHFAGQRVLVTGAAGLIGSALVEAFLLQGAFVEAVDIDEAGLRALQSRLRVDYGAVEADRLSLHVADLRDESVVGKLAESIDSLDVLINNAGTNGGVGALQKTTSADWRNVLDVNVVAPARLTGLLVPKLAAAESGSVVMVSSIHAVAPSKLAAYAASKAALAKLVDDLAIALAVEGIRVNAVAPGWVPAADADPELRAKAAQPLGPALIPVEAVVHAVLFLADRTRSPVTTGQHLAVDGGSALRGHDFAAL